MYLVLRALRPPAPSPVPDSRGPDCHGLACRSLPPVALLSLALALFSACATPGTPSARPAPGPSGVEAPVLGPSGVEAGNEELGLRALLLTLVDRQMYEPLAVREALRGGPSLRRELAVTLGRVGDPRGRPTLEELLFDDQPEVRRAAAFALGELEDRAARRALLARVDDPDRETGVLAVEALAKIGEPVGTVEAALAGLRDEERRARLLPHLFRFDPASVVEIARRGLDSPEPQLHARAAYALARNPQPEAAAELRRLLADPDPWVRGWAARALGQVGEGGDLERLRPLLEDEEPGPVIQALRAGGRLVDEGKGAPPASWRPRLVELVEDPRPHLRAAVLEVAGLWLLDPDLGDALTRLAQGESPVQQGADGADRGWERGSALGALARGGDPRARDLLDAASRDRDPRLRQAAAAAGALLGDWELVERLGHDPEPRVRIASLEQRLERALEVGAGDGEPAPGQALAASALADTDAGVRSFLFGWLEEHPVVPLEVLGEALVLSLRDLNVESSLGAVRALRARAEAEPLERGALVSLIEKLAEGSDYLVRREAVAALEALGREAPPLGTVDTGRSVEIYELILERAASPRTVEIRTARGAVRVRLACPRFPLTCVSFLNLARQGFYDGLTFHRVVPDFVVQGGDPRGDGYGGPGYTIRDEIGRLRYGDGVLGMALAGPDTGGSQFFITLSPQPHLDGGYTAFGEVVGGRQVLEEIAPGGRIETVVEVAR